MLLRESLMTASDGLTQPRDVFLRVIHLHLLLKLKIDHLLNFLLNSCVVILLIYASL